MVTVSIKALKVDGGKLTLRLSGMSGEVQADSFVLSQFTKAELFAYIKASENQGQWFTVAV